MKGTMTKVIEEIRNKTENMIGTRMAPEKSNFS